MDSIKISERSKKPLSIYDDNYRLIMSEEKQIKIITFYFTQLFSSNDSVNLMPPEKMKPSCSRDEVKKACR